MHLISEARSLAYIDDAMSTISFIMGNFSRSLNLGEEDESTVDYVLDIISRNEFQNCCVAHGAFIKFGNFYNSAFHQRYAGVGGETEEDYYRAERDRLLDMLYEQAAIQGSVSKVHDQDIINAIKKYKEDELYFDDADDYVYVSNAELDVISSNIDEYDTSLNINIVPIDYGLCSEITREGHFCVFMSSDCTYLGLELVVTENRKLESIMKDVHSVERASFRFSFEESGDTFGINI